MIIQRTYHNTCSSRADGLRTMKCDKVNYTKLEDMMNQKYSDTIAAISTAVSSSGIGIVRLKLQIRYMLEKKRSI